MLKRGGRCADHQAVAELQAQTPPLVPTSTNSIPASSGLGATQRVREVRVAAVDDDVALGEMWHELLERALDRPPAGTMIQTMRRGSAVEPDQQDLGAPGAFADM